MNMVKTLLKEQSNTDLTQQVAEEHSLSLVAHQVPNSFRTYEQLLLLFHQLEYLSLRLDNTSHTQLVASRHSQVRRSR
jgi:hypothetical protein